MYTFPKQLSHTLTRDQGKGDGRACPVLRRDRDTGLLLRSAAPGSAGGLRSPMAFFSQYLPWKVNLSKTSQAELDEIVSTTGPTVLRLEETV